MMKRARIYIDIVKNYFGAYGTGVEYAYMMAHAPETKYPDYVVLVAAHR